MGVPARVSGDSIHTTRRRRGCSIHQQQLGWVCRVRMVWAVHQHGRDRRPDWIAGILQQRPPGIRYRSAIRRFGATQQVVRAYQYSSTAACSFSFCPGPYKYTYVRVCIVRTQAWVPFHGISVQCRTHTHTSSIDWRIAYGRRSFVRSVPLRTVESRKALIGFAVTWPAQNVTTTSSSTVTVDHVTHFMHDTSPRNFRRVRPYAGCRVTQLLCPLCVLTAHMPSPGIYRHFTCAVPVPPRSSLLLCLHSAGVALSVALPPLYGYEVHVPTTYGRHRQRVVVDDAPAPPDARVARARAWLSLSGERFPGVAHG
jgi:hypothetical protein